MKPNRTLIGVAAVLALAVIAVVLLTLPESQPPVTGPTGATVAVPPELAADQPAEAQAPATPTPAAQAPAAPTPAAQAPAVPAPAQVAATLSMP